MNVFEKHQLKIAKDTLKLSVAGMLIMGGMTKEQAIAVIRRLDPAYYKKIEEIRK